MFQFVLELPACQIGGVQPQKRAQRLPERFDNHREGYKDNLVFFSAMDDLVDAMCGLIGFPPSIYYFKFGEQTLQIICKHQLLYVSSQSTLIALSLRQRPPGSFSPSWLTFSLSDQKCLCSSTLKSSNTSCWNCVPSMLFFFHTCWFSLKQEAEEDCAAVSYFFHSPTGSQSSCS